MKHVHRLKKTVATAFGLLFLGTNCLFAYTPERSFWEERRKASSRDTHSPLLIANVPMSSGDKSTIESFPAISKFGSTASLRNDLIRSLPKGFLPRHTALFRALPPKSVTVRKISFPDRPQNAGSPIVVHIQDVHQNLDAQKNIAQTIRSLLAASPSPASAGKGNLLKLIALEGAWDEMRLQPIRDFPNRKAVELTADYLLKENKISGPIHAALTWTGALPPVIGIDDPAHYNANVDAYRQSSPQVEFIKKELAQQKRALDQEKALLFSHELKSLDAAADAYVSRKSSLGAYVQALISSSSNLSVPPSIQAFQKAVTLEKAIDFNQVERERVAVIDQLVQKLTRPQMDNLIAQSAAYRSGQVRYADFYAFLHTLCLSAGIPLQNYPALTQYIRYVLLSDRINVDTLFGDLMILERAAYTALAKTHDIHDLVQKSRAARLTSKLVDFSLTPEEWKEYLKAKGQEREDKINVVSFENFYKEADTRDHAMASRFLNALKKDDSGPGISVIVTGGYHSPGLTEQLTKAGATVISVVPKIEKLDTTQGSAYLSVFTQEKTPLEQLFQGEKLFLAAHPAPPSILKTLCPALLVMVSLSLAAAIGGLDPQAAYVAAGGVGFLSGIKMMGDSLLAEIKSDQAVVQVRMETGQGTKIIKVTETPAPSSTRDEWAIGRWSMGSWKYRLYTTVGVNWEAIYFLPLWGLHLFLPSGAAALVGIFLLFPAALFFARRHPQEHRTAILKAGVWIGAMTVLPGVLDLLGLTTQYNFHPAVQALFGNFLAHTGYNSWALFTGRPVASLSRGKVNQLRAAVGQDRDRPWVEDQKEWVIEELFYFSGGIRTSDLIDPETNNRVVSDFFGNYPSWVYKIKHVPTKKIFFLGPDDVVNVFQGFPDQLGEVRAMRRDKSAQLQEASRRLRELQRVQRWLGMTEEEIGGSWPDPSRLGDWEIEELRRRADRLEHQWRIKVPNIPLEEGFKMLEDLTKVWAAFKTRQGRTTIFSKEDLARLGAILKELEHGTSLTEVDQSFLFNLHKALLARQTAFQRESAAWGRRQAVGVMTDHQTKTPAFHANVWIAQWLMDQKARRPNWNPMILDVGANLSVLWQVLQAMEQEHSHETNLSSNVVDLERDWSLHASATNPLRVQANISDVSNVFSDPAGIGDLIETPHQFDVVSASFVLDQLEGKGVLNALKSFEHLLKIPIHSLGAEDSFTEHPLLFVASPEHAPLSETLFDRFMTTQGGYRRIFQESLSNSLTLEARERLTQEGVDPVKVDGMIGKLFHVTIYAKIAAADFSEVNFQDVQLRRGGAAREFRSSDSETAGVRLNMDHLLVLDVLPSLKPSDFDTVSSDVIARQAIVSDRHFGRFEDHLTALAYGESFLDPAEKKNLKAIRHRWDEDTVSFLPKYQVEFVLQRPLIPSVRYDQLPSHLKSDVDAEHKLLLSGEREMATATVVGRGRRLTNADYAYIDREVAKKRKELQSHFFSLLDLYKKEEAFRKKEKKEPISEQMRPRDAMRLLAIRTFTRGYMAAHGHAPNLVDTAKGVRLSRNTVTDLIKARGLAPQDYGIAVRITNHAIDDNERWEQILAFTRTFKETNGREPNMSEAADGIEMARTTFYTWMRTRGLKEENLGVKKDEIIIPVDHNEREGEIRAFTGQFLKDEGRKPNISETARGVELSPEGLKSWLKNQDINAKDLGIEPDVRAIPVDHAKRRTEIQLFTSQFMGENGGRRPNISQVAAVIGTDFTSLRDWIRNQGLEPNDLDIDIGAKGREIAIRSFTAQFERDQGRRPNLAETAKGIKLNRSTLGAWISSNAFQFEDLGIESGNEPVNVEERLASMQIFSKGFEQSHGRRPNVTEIARGINLKPSTLISWLRKVSNPAVIDNPVGERLRTLNGAVFSMAYWAARWWGTEEPLARKIGILGLLVEIPGLVWLRLLAEDPSSLGGGLFAFMGYDPVWGPLFTVGILMFAWAHFYIKSEVAEIEGDTRPSLRSLWGSLALFSFYVLPGYALLGIGVVAHVIFDFKGLVMNPPFRKGRTISSLDVTNDGTTIRLLSSLPEGVKEEEKYRSVRFLVTRVVKGQVHYLLLKNRKGRWECPGGGVDGDESTEEAVGREAGEELGPDVKNAIKGILFFGPQGNEKYQFVHSIEKGETTSYRLVYTGKAELDAGVKIHLNHESIEERWVTLDEFMDRYLLRCTVSTQMTFLNEILEKQYGITNIVSISPLDKSPAAESGAPLLITAGNNQYVFRSAGENMFQARLNVVIQYLLKLSAGELVERKVGGRSPDSFIFPLGRHPMVLEQFNEGGQIVNRAGATQAHFEVLGKIAGQISYFFNNAPYGHPFGKVPLIDLDFSNVKFGGASEGPRVNGIESIDTRQWGARVELLIRIGRGTGDPQKLLAMVEAFESVAGHLTLDENRIFWKTINEEYSKGVSSGNFEGESPSTLEWLLKRLPNQVGFLDTILRRAPWESVVLVVGMGMAVGAYFLQGASIGWVAGVPFVAGVFGYSHKWGTYGFVNGAIRVVNPPSLRKAISWFFWTAAFGSVLFGMGSWVSADIFSWVLGGTTWAGAVGGKQAHQYRNREWVVNHLDNGNLTPSQKDMARRILKNLETKPMTLGVEDIRGLVQQEAESYSRRPGSQVIEMESPFAFLGEGIKLYFMDSVSLATPGTLAKVQSLMGTDPDFYIVADRELEALPTGRVIVWGSSFDSRGGVFEVPLVSVPVSLRNLMQDRPIQVLKTPLLALNADGLSENDPLRVASKNAWVFVLELMRAFPSESFKWDDVWHVFRALASSA